MKFTLLFATYFALTEVAYGQENLDSLRIILAGPNKKEWFAEPWQTIMGSTTTKKCKGGESYIFHKDGQLEHTKCVDGNFEKKSMPWSISRESNDNLLHIGNIVYQIRRKINSADEIQLRRLEGVKRIPSLKVILKYEKY
jgi:hypothetical protein